MLQNNLDASCNLPILLVVRRNGILQVLKKIEGQEKDWVKLANFDLEITHHNVLLDKGSEGHRNEYLATCTTVEPKRKFFLSLKREDCDSNN